MTVVSEANKEDEVPEGKSVLVVLDTSGDSKIIWDKGNEAEVAAAKAQFDTLIGKGYQAYSVKRNGDKGEVIRTFDPDAEKIILAPATRGG